MLLYCLSHLQTTEESIKRAVNKKPKVSQPQLKPNPKRIANPAFEPLSIRLRTQTAGEAPYRDANACLAILFTSRCQTAIFFAKLKNVHCACAPFTKSPIAQPAPPIRITETVATATKAQPPAKKKHALHLTVFSRMGIAKAAQAFPLGVNPQTPFKGGHPPPNGSPRCGILFNVFLTTSSRSF